MEVAIILFTVNQGKINGREGKTKNKGRHLFGSKIKRRQFYLKDMKVNLVLNDRITKINRFFLSI